MSPFLSPLFSSFCPPLPSSMLNFLYHHVVVSTLLALSAIVSCKLSAVFQYVAYLRDFVFSSHRSDTSSFSLALITGRGVLYMSASSYSPHSHPGSLHMLHEDCFIYSVFFWYPVWHSYSIYMHQRAKEHTKDKDGGLELNLIGFWLGTCSHSAFFFACVCMCVFEGCRNPTRFLIQSPTGLAFTSCQRTVLGINCL